MKMPDICAAIVADDPAAIERAGPEVDLFEVRIDLIGSGWRDVVKRLGRPWIACNRIMAEGGAWSGGEPERVAELLDALELGAKIIDIELATAHLDEVVRRVKGKAACLISYHDTTATPPLEGLRDVVRRQLASGADICKVVTTARNFADNSPVLQLPAEFPEARLVSFAMGHHGFASRVLSPVFGGHFVYASLEAGRESAPGQLTVSDFRKIYGMEE